MKLLIRIILCLLLVVLSSQAFSEVDLDSDDNVARLTGTWTQANNAAGFYGNDFATAQGTGT